MPIVTINDRIDQTETSFKSVCIEAGLKLNMMKT